MDKLRLFTDGGSRGNPGPSAAAFVICKMDNSVVEKSGKYLGMTTNNQAEYQALIAGLERVRELRPTELEVIMDSELVIKQLQGLYKVKKPELMPLFNQAKELSRQIPSISFNHVLRSANSVADAEVNRILDSQSRL